MRERLISFIARAFSENGEPSSSRIIGGYQSISSMGLIWWMVRHMMTQPLDKLQVWMGGLPMIIGALATFSVSQYGVSKLAGMFKKDKPKDSGVDNPDA